MEPRRAAIIVGVNRYDQDVGIRPLEFAVDDCTELHGFLRHKAGYDPARLLLEPSKAQVLEAFEQVTATLGPGDLLVFFFAGHGVEFNGKHLLLCRPARLSRLRHFDEVIPVEQLRDETAKPGLHRIIILDSCRSDLLRTRDASGGAGLKGERLLRDVVSVRANERESDSGSIAILCSCPENARALELPTKRQGLFSAALMEQLEEEFRKGNEARLSDIFIERLGLRMQRIAQESGDAEWTQFPWIQKSGPVPVLVSGRKPIDLQRRGNNLASQPLNTPSSKALNPPEDSRESEREVDLRQCIARDITEATRGIRLGQGSAGYLKQVVSERLSDWQEGVRVHLPEALWLVGRCHQDGIGLPQNLVIAVRLFQQAAEQGLAAAQASLGLCYREGEGVVQDEFESFNWFRKAAEQGHAVAQIEVGYCYRYGKGVEVNHLEALRWYSIAAEQGHPRAQFSLGGCFELGIGHGVDKTEAARWYRKAAEKGFAPAQHCLGKIFQGGDGVSKDPAEAVKWFRKAADQGYVQAQHDLGWCYEWGIGVSEDLKESATWYRKAAEQGLAKAQFCLARCYESGKGVEKDQRRAIEWHQKAAEQGHDDAQFRLGLLYEDSVGVKQDITEAIEWFRRAAIHGHESAKAGLLRLKS